MADLVSCISLLSSFSGALLHLPREELYGTVARLEVGDSDAK